MMEHGLARIRLALPRFQPQSQPQLASSREKGLPASLENMLMGRGGGRERPSEAKLRENRENGRRARPAARRAADVGEEETLRQALRRGRGLTEQAVAVLEQ